MSKNDIRPTTIRGIKRVAKELKTADGLIHAKALDKAALLAGFENYAHARRRLPQPEGESRERAVRLSVDWRTPDGAAAGCEAVTLRLKSSVPDLIRNQALEVITRDHVRRTETVDSRDWARELACFWARRLTFMDVTTLRPGPVGDEVWSGDDWLDDLPDADHLSLWMDPSTGTRVTVDEPYELPMVGIPEHRVAWATEHGRSLARSRFWGMHAPRCRLYMTTKGGSAYDLDAACAALDALPPPLWAERWGERPETSSHDEPSLHAHA